MAVSRIGDPGAIVRLFRSVLALLICWRYIIFLQACHGREASRV